MTKLNYALIGTIPSMEIYRDTLGEIMSRFETDGKALLTGSELDAESVIILKLTQMTTGVVIELCAEHFYGIEAASAMSMAELIDTIRSMDQELAAR